MVVLFYLQNNQSADMFFLIVTLHLSVTGFKL